MDELTAKMGGWNPIPGGAKGGMRRRHGKGWEYSYPRGVEPHERSDIRESLLSEPAKRAREAGARKTKKSTQTEELLRELMGKMRHAGKRLAAKQKPARAPKRDIPPSIHTDQEAGRRSSNIARGVGRIIHGGRSIVRQTVAGAREGLAGRMSAELAAKLKPARGPKTDIAPRDVGPKRVHGGGTGPTPERSFVRQAQARRHQERRQAPPARTIKRVGAEGVHVSKMPTPGSQAGRTAHEVGSPGRSGRVSMSGGMSGAPAGVVTPTDARQPMHGKNGPPGELPPRRSSMRSPPRARTSAQGHARTGELLVRPGAPRRNVASGSAFDRRDTHTPGLTSQRTRRGTKVVANMQRSMTDIDGRPVLQKGELHKFTSYNPKGEASLPEKFLFDYLCSFIEEAYEHERAEPAHKHITHYLSNSLPEYFARLIMGELVACMPKNKNLMRAAKKYKVTQDVISRLLVAKGIMRPRSDSMSTDSDSARAMGASLLAESEPMAYSNQNEWLQGGVEREGMRFAKSAVDNVASQIRDDSIDPAAHLANRRSVEMTDLWEGAEHVASANVRSDCPVHGGRDFSKAQNLWNPMTPCTCHDELRAYG